MSRERKRMKIDVERYHRMIDAGIFARGERVELIEGELLAMTPIGSLHAFAGHEFVRQLYAAGAESRSVIAQGSPLVLGDSSEPEPDVVLLRLPADRYRASKPTERDVLLVIEIAQSSLKFDRGPKLALYARFAIPEVWICDLDGRQLECFTEPLNGTYERSRSLGVGDAAEPALLPGIALPWGRIFG